MLAHLMSNEESIQHLGYLKNTGQFEECLQQGILLLPQIHTEKQQATILCELIESAYQLGKYQETAYFLPLFEKTAGAVKESGFSIRRLLFKGHLHIQIHGDTIAGLAYYQEGLSLAFEEKEYTSLALFIKYIIRYSGSDVEVDKLLPLAELAYVFSQRIDMQNEGLRISAMIALMECYCLAGKWDEFEELEKQLSALPSLPNFPNELARLQLLRAKIWREQGYVAQAFCLMDQATMYYEQRQEYTLLLEQLYIQKDLCTKSMQERVAALEERIERIHKLAHQVSSRFHYSGMSEELYCEDKAVIHFHQSLEKQLANKKELLYVLAFTEDPACYEALIDYPATRLVLSGNRVLYMMEGREIPSHFPACNLPGIFLAVICPQDASSAMELFHEAHAKLYYRMHNRKQKTELSHISQ